MKAPSFTEYPDLASRLLAGSVVFANDELFAERENLIKPGPSVFSKEAFGHKGKVYDGWETRRRRDESGNDFAIIRLGVPGVLHGVVIDTSWFTGNYPPYASVEGASIEGYPSPEELERAEWTTLVAKSAISGDSENFFEIADEGRYTHVRLSIYPDGGVARFRVHGTPRPDPRLLTGTVDLAALENGGHVIDCSNAFYSSPNNMLLPGRARIMGDGWENARRRDAGNEHVTIRLAAKGRVRRVEIDTSYFVGNAPGWASLTGDDDVVLVPRTRLQPDTRHFFVVESALVSQVRLDVIPDGGLARLRVHGEIEPDVLDRLLSLNAPRDFL
ncbi:allantoicase [Microtetraspora malaysiensis]|uniref:allantoicase n=1 Tax=Microtetraspora malaysiensis TaxID=161358 RepID=UPI0008361E25|nr:allantoicase [Microtetraspora malaysiensis]